MLMVFWLKWGYLILQEEQSFICLQVGLLWQVPSISKNVMLISVKIASHPPTFLSYCWAQGCFGLDGSASTPVLRLQPLHWPFLPSLLPIPQLLPQVSIGR